MYNDLCSDLSHQLDSSDQTPISLALTEFHLLLLYPTMLKIVCVLNRQVILVDQFSGNYGRPCGICKDPIRGTIWVFTELAVYRYKVVQEDRNIWEIYLAKKDWKSARHYAGNDVIKLDRTVCEEAMNHFANGE